MAEYIAKTRTNYFGVTDAEAFKRLIAEAFASNGGKLTVISNQEPDGSMKYGFYCDGQLQGLITAPAEDEDEDDEYDLDAFYARLQNCVAPGDACIVQEAGFEAMRYMAGYAAILTHDQKRFLNLSNLAQVAAKDMLGSPDWTTHMEY